MLRSVEQRPVGIEGVDPRVTELRSAVSRLRRELAAHRAEFADREIAEGSSRRSPPWRSAALRRYGGCAAPC